VPVPDVLVDLVLVGSFVDVAADVLTVGDRIAVRPRLERVAEGVHVRVRADARIAEQVPGAAGGLTRLEDRVRLARAHRLQAVRGPDAGQTCADEQHVYVVVHRNLRGEQVT
jgi:hypothetical protein